MSDQMPYSVSDLAATLSELTAIYRELQGLLHDWLQREIEETFLQRQETLIQSIAEHHNRLDAIQSHLASRFTLGTFRTTKLKHVLSEVQYTKIASQYNTLVEVIKLTKELNQKVIGKIESDKQLALQEMQELQKVKKLPDFYWPDGQVEPRFFDRKK